MQKYPTDAIYIKGKCFKIKPVIEYISIIAVDQNLTFSTKQFAELKIKTSVCVFAYSQVS